MNECRLHLTCKHYLTASALTPKRIFKDCTSRDEGRSTFLKFKTAPKQITLFYTVQLQSPSIFIFVVLSVKLKNFVLCQQSSIQLFIQISACFALSLVEVSLFRFGSSVQWSEEKRAWISPPLKAERRAFAENQSYHLTANSWLFSENMWEIFCACFSAIFGFVVRALFTYLRWGVGQKSLLPSVPQMPCSVVIFSCHCRPCTL